MLEGDAETWLRRCQGEVGALGSLTRRGPIGFYSSFRAALSQVWQRLGITRGYLLCLESKSSDLGSELNKEREQTQLLLVQRPQTGEELRGAAVAPAAGFCSEGHIFNDFYYYYSNSTRCFVKQGIHQQKQRWSL